MLNKDQNGSHIIGIVLIILVLGVVGFAGFKVFSSNNNQLSTDKRGPNYKALAKCGKQPLTKLPADLGKLEAIQALGNVDPPGHTLPTDHMYMTYEYGTTEQREMYAPSDIVITAVSYGEVKENGSPKTNDSRVDFYSCSELKIIYGHVDTLSDAITAVIGKPENAPADRCRTSTQGAEEIRTCDWETDIKLSAGDLVGTANGWDLWATYEGAKGKVISPEYYHNVDAVCPLDYWTDDLKSQMYAVVNRKGDPKCGEAYQDIAGTLQGGWFAHQDPEKAKTDWGSHLSLSHNSSDTSIGQLGVAGVIADQFMYRFTPKTTGTINTEPSVTKTGTVYCYQHEGLARFPNGRMAGSGKVLMKTTDTHTLQVEKKDGTCTENETISNPTTYYR